MAVVQCRWEHVNRDFSALTEVQALMLDGHFIMEHAGRNWSGRFFNFNGTAGIWRRAAIADAGGWQHDTLTEDMDLSYRAQLRGWKFVYLPEIAAPAELPVEMSAFKSQQFRWAKGSVQVAKKLLPTILRSNATFAQKSGGVLPPHQQPRLPAAAGAVDAAAAEPGAARAPRLARGAADRPAALLRHDGLGRVVLPRLAARDRAHARPGRAAALAWSAVKRLPLMMSIGIGLCVNQTRAVLEALLGRETEFVRTPKHGIRGKLESWSGKKYRAAKSLTPFIELAWPPTSWWRSCVAVDHGHYMSMPFLCLFLCGFGYVGWGSVWQGGIGAALRGIVDRHGRRGVTVVAPPAYPVVAGRATDSLSGEIVIDDAARRTARAPSADA